MRPIALLVLALAAACSVGRPADNATGEEIYTLVCANCHGAELEGALAPGIGAGSNSAGRPDEFLEVTITHGRGRMPSFASSLSEDQVRRLVAYVREVQSR